jgi:DNA-binding HxlR family transcriptional regulator
MRSYNQYCALAKALDVVGDRWTLLIIRELLLGPKRYTDLHKGLPGIATNLLADRLTDLEQAGLLEREDAPPPIATTLYRLTPRGEDLRPVIHALGRWAQPLMGQPAKHETIRTEWLALPIEMYLSDGAPGRAPIAIEVRSGERPITVETVDGEVRASVGTVKTPDAVITARPEVALALLLGRVDLPTARSRGLKFEGDEKALRRLQVSGG